jgi:hypothetical protein
MRVRLFSRRHRRLSLDFHLLSMYVLKDGIMSFSLFAEWKHAGVRLMMDAVGGQGTLMYKHIIPEKGSKVKRGCLGQYGCSKIVISILRVRMVYNGEDTAGRSSFGGRDRFAAQVAVSLPTEPEQLSGPWSPNSLVWAHLDDMERGAT